MREDIKELIESAKEDLEVAKLAFERKFYNSALFHTHQCVEKLLKAYLLYKTNRYPFIHSISRLLQEALELDKSFEYLVKIKVYKLDKYYTRTRYPPLLKIEEEEIENVLEIAEKARKFILEALSKHIY